MGLPARKLDRIYTYADYKTWPDDERWELIEGVAWNMSPAPNLSHQSISMAFSSIIHTWLRSKECVVFAAPFDVVLPDGPGQHEDQATTVVQPDVAVICDRAKLRPWGCFGAPDWAIEILSPYTSKKDMSDKLALYEKHRVAEYWIVDPGNRYIHVYRLGADGRYGDPLVLVGEASAESNVCAGLAIPLTEIFVGP